MKLRAIAGAALIGLLTAAAPSDGAFTRTWLASSGHYPDADCLWHRATSDSTQASLGPSALTISTVLLPDNHYYYQAGAELEIPDPWVIEARIRIGTNADDGLAATSAAIGFAPAANIENLLFIGAGHIYLWNSPLVIGPEAFLDTQSAAHTYRIEVAGNGATSVYYDDALTLTGTASFDQAFEDSTTVWWGDGTSHASGSSSWEYVTHNGNAHETCQTPARMSTWGGIKGLYRH